jgi:hypothetical protein
MTHHEISRLRMQNQQLLSGNISTAAELVYHFGAVQAQEYEQTKWGLGIRLPHLDNAAIELEIESGKICRTHLLRPTWHLVHVDDIHWMQALTSERVQAINRYMYRQVELTDKILDRANTIILKALGQGESLTRAELSSIISRHRINTEGLRMSHIMMNAELKGLVANGKRKGKQHTYSLLKSKRKNTADREEGLTKLTERYFKSRGPATARDFSTWSGLTVTDCQSGINLIGAVLEKFSFADDIYYHIAPVGYNENSWVPTKVKQELFLLPVYDELIMGYKNRQSIMQKFIKGQQYKYNCMILYKGQVAGTYKRIIKSETAYFEFDHFQSPGKKQENLINAELKKFERFFQLRVIVLAD